MDDRRSSSGIGKLHLDALPRGDKGDVFLTPLSAFSSGCTLSENEDFVILEGSRRTNETLRATFDYFFWT